MSEPIRLDPSSLTYTRTPKLVVADQSEKPAVQSPADLEADLHTKQAAMERRWKIGELIGAMKRKAVHEKGLQLQQERAERNDKLLARPPVPAQVLDGIEAARALQLARKLAEEIPLSLPPRAGSTFVFADKDYNYTMYHDGRITRSEQGVLTPEQWHDQAKAQRELKALLASGVYESQIAEADRRIAQLQDELGPIGDDEWGPQLESGNFVSLRV